jgi:hypothetical protein
MVIAIGANGDGVLHWCHYVHHHWSQWITIGTIFLSPLAPMAPMARTPNRYDTFADPALENEVHVLQTCPLYKDHLSNSMTKPARDCLNNDLKELFKDRNHILPLVKLTLKIHQRRFLPKNNETDPTKVF